MRSLVPGNLGLGRVSRPRCPKRASVPSSFRGPAVGGGLPPLLPAFPVPSSSSCVLTFSTPTWLCTDLVSGWWSLFSSPYTVSPSGQAQSTLVPEAQWRVLFCFVLTDLLHEISQCTSPLWVCFPIIKMSDWGKANPLMSLSTKRCYRSPPDHTWQ